ncbi:putative secreted protein (Por secretion system target) [Flavobacterium aquicola]|uniref:Putative secreted protein (Por secretion system target) n=2 Tax=Flavobacterium aquicola TaxID=1682742 RepID=A0A3E0EMQ8_9FLAO|nr:putative secreted protein (Por secretion system target) [Flavobacterium aquicola]
MNTNLNYLICNSNRLANLNLKNGKNVNFGDTHIDFTENLNLICIQVDDVDYSNLNWPNKKNFYATYSTSCSWLGISEAIFDKIAVYPNPTKEELYIDNIILEKATVYNVSGQLVRTFTLDSANTNNTINLSGLPKGVYFVYLINQDAASVKKVIVE